MEACISRGKKFHCASKHFFTLAISVIFSLKHIFSLLGHKIGLDVVRVISTELLALIINHPLRANFKPIHQRH